MSTLTRNLKLRLTDDLTADAKYNLERIDLVATNIDFAGTADIILRSKQGITIQPNASDIGGSGTGGDINLGSEGNPVNNVNVYSLETCLNGNVTFAEVPKLEGLKLLADAKLDTNFVQLLAPAGLSSDVSFTLPSADGAAGQVLQTSGSGELSWTSVSTDSLPENNVKIGDGSSNSVSVDTDAVGTIQASVSGGLTLKSQVITDGDVSLSAAINADKIDDTLSTNKFITTAEKAQLAQNTSDISTNASGISTNVTNISNNTSALSGKQDTSEKGAANGYAGLDAGGKVPSAQLPQIALSEVFVVADIPARDALTVEEGDVASVTSTSQTFIYDGAAWIEISGAGAVDSVNGQTGTVSLSLDNISDVNAGGILLGGELLTFDGAIWSPVTPAPVVDSLNGETGSVTLDLNKVSDVDLTTVAPSTNDVLSYDGTNWVPAIPSASVSSIDDLSDVDTSSIAPVVADSLYYDGTNWVPTSSVGSVDISAAGSNLSTNYINNSITTVDFNSVSIGSEVFDTTTDRFTAPSDGVYYFEGRLSIDQQFNPPGDGQSSRTWFSLNGGLVKGWRSKNAGTEGKVTFQNEILMELTTGDTVEFVFEAVAGGTSQQFNTDSFDTETVTDVTTTFKQIRLADASADIAAFRAHNDNGASGTQTYPTVDFDGGSNYTAGTSTYTAPSNGVYVFHSTAGRFFRGEATTQFRVNGTIVDQREMITDGIDRSVDQMAILELTSGDAVTVTHVDTSSISHTDAHNFWGWKIADTAAAAKLVDVAQSSAAVIADETATILSFPTENTDTDSQWATDTFTASAAGKYLVSAYLQFVVSGPSNVETERDWVVYAKVNGTLKAINYTMQLNSLDIINTQSVNFNETLDLQAGDTVQFGMFQNFGTETITLNLADTSLRIAQISTVAASVSPVDGLNGLSDVDVTTVTPNVGDHLEYDGTNWVPAAPSGGSFVGFKAYHTTTFAWTNLAFTQVPFNTALFDSDTAYNTGTNTYVVPETGYYQFNTSVAIQTPTATGTVGLEIYVNGVSQAANYGTLDNVSFAGASVSALLFVTAGDSITVQAYQDSGSATTSFNGVNYTYFDGHKVG